MSATKPAERALEGMRRSLAEEPVPELPWDAMEQRLLARIDEAEAASPRASRPSPEARAWGRRAVFALAAAAAVALGVWGASRSGGDGASAPAIRWRAPETIALLPGSSAERDLAALRVGEGVEAGEAPLTLVRRGVVRVSLAPRSRAVVRASGGAGEALVVALERGELRAEVTPRSSPEGLVETFAVEVGRTRVAAHGTAFRVIRGESDVVVDLEHGAVAVGPVGNGGVTTGRLLVGRARASFSLDGGTLARTLPIEDAPPPVEPSQPAPPAPPPETSTTTNPADRRPPPVAVATNPGVTPTPPRLPGAQAAPIVEAPAPPPPEVAPSRVLTRASVNEGLQRCFDQHYGASDPSVRVSAAGTLILSLAEDGSVSTARFDPPLEPSFQTCVWGAVRPGHFEGVKGSLSVPFNLAR
ncbi:FecR family protein [Polyangium aurulentum]|uniref:FecR family protein n=1 Tax=Polyangium aurulentum TaxID=2567896 RepID=UPI0010AE66EE|nr:FecR family protein [Polyangium aurulentum]UQA58786.1 FecR family protein [Polyangium aurulentum]